MPLPPFECFQQLPDFARIALVLAEGTLLGSRAGWADTEILLYHLGDFFAELSYDTQVDLYYHCQAFQSTAPLLAYADLVQLPEL
jgi:carbohydrate-selective porin OprB